jgi:putative chitinase
LVDLAATLEEVQRLVGPIHINSAFRSARLNKEIGGSPHSAHLDGYACDFTAPGFGTPREVCQAIAGSGIPFDQIIAEGTQDGGGWCHLSVAPAMRKEVLTATFVSGKVVYSAGLGSNETRLA